jgi:hypothetical protein
METWTAPRIVRKTTLTVPRMLSTERSGRTWAAPPGGPFAKGLQRVRTVAGEVAGDLRRVEEAVEQLERVEEAVQQEAGAVQQGGEGGQQRAEVGPQGAAVGQPRAEEARA